MKKGSGEKPSTPRPAFPLKNPDVEGVTMYAYAAHQLIRDLTEQTVAAQIARWKCIRGFAEAALVDLGSED
jgi:hypothetical protein